jgi:nucleotide-binding universal stress UspA family protein
MYKTILYANDGSEGAFKALGSAIEMARLTGARLHMVSVEELPQFAEVVDEVRTAKAAADHRYHAVVRRAEEMVSAKGVAMDIHVVAGHPVASIVDLAAQLGADLLVVGATGYAKLFGRMIGSRATRIVEVAACSVLVVK